AACAARRSAIRAPTRHRAECRGGTEIRPRADSCRRRTAPSELAPVVAEQAVLLDVRVVLINRVFVSLEPRFGLGLFQGALERFLENLGQVQAKLPGPF